MPLIKETETKVCYLTHSWGNTGVHIFPKGICPKVNVIARQEFELAYIAAAVQYFSQPATESTFLLIGCLIDLECMSIPAGLFYTLRLGNRVQCTLYLHLLNSCVFVFFFHGPIEYE